MELIQLKYSGHIFKNFRNVFPTNTDIKAKPSVQHDLDLWGLFDFCHSKPHSPFSAPGVPPSRFLYSWAQAKPTTEII